MKAMGLILYFPHLIIAAWRYQSGNKHPFKWLGSGFLYFVSDLDSDDLPEANSEFVRMAKLALAAKEA